MSTFATPYTRNIDLNQVEIFDWAEKKGDKVHITADSKESAEILYRKLSDIHTRQSAIRRAGEAITGKDLETLQLRTALPLDIEGAEVFAFSVSTTIRDDHGTLVDVSALRKFAKDANAMTAQFNDEHDDRLKIGRVFDGEVRPTSDGEHELLLFVRVLSEVHMPGQEKLSVQKAIKTGEIEHTSIGFLGRGEMQNGVFTIRHDPEDPRFSGTRLVHLALSGSPSNPRTSRRSAAAIDLEEIPEPTTKEIKSIMEPITRSIKFGEKEFTVTAEVKDEKLCLRGVEDATIALEAHTKGLAERAEAAEKRCADFLEKDLNDIANLSKDLSERNASIFTIEKAEAEKWEVKQIQERAEHFRKLKADENGGAYVHTGKNGETEKLEY